MKYPKYNLYDDSYIPEYEEYVEYCHRFNVKTYLTLNTLVSDVEFEKALEKRLCDVICIYTQYSLIGICPT